MSATPLQLMAVSSLSGCLDVAEAPWPAPRPVATATSGAPATQTIELIDSPEFVGGLWRCSPGEYRSVHDGFIEYLHALEGLAVLTGDDGVVWTLRPGTLLVIPDGWQGTWRVEETVVKCFAIYRHPAVAVPRSS